MSFSNQHLTRHADLINESAYKNTITIVGAGSIGSFLSLQLAKTGYVRQMVYDYDTVDIVNMSCQFFRLSDIGKSKVEALKELVFDFTEVNLTVFNKKWSAEEYINGIIVNASDSMKVREELLNAAVSKGKKWYLDSRMGAESALIYCVDLESPEALASYRKTLYSDAEAVQERCTAKATIYTANLVSGMLTKIIKNITNGENYPHITLWSIKENDCTQFTTT